MSLQQFKAANLLSSLDVFIGKSVYLRVCGEYVLIRVNVAFFTFVWSKNAAVCVRFMSSVVWIFLSLLIHYISTKKPLHALMETWLCHNKIKARPIE